MANEKLFYVGVKGLIRNKDGEILVLKSSLRGHSPGAKVYWDIPGGRIEKGSDALRTLRREIEEETGIVEISGIQFLYAVVSHHEIPIDESAKAGLLLMIYTITVPEDVQVILSDEHTEYEWVDSTVACERLANKYPAEFTNLLKS